MHTITNQKQLRAEFWRNHPGASRKKVADYAGKRAAMFVCGIRGLCRPMRPRRHDIRVTGQPRNTWGWIMRTKPISNFKKEPSVTRGQVHRFGDQVALWLGDGETLYMTHEQAEALGVMLAEYAADIRLHDFVNSTIGTYPIGGG
jgi:hypothetical protein